MKANLKFLSILIMTLAIVCLSNVALAGEWTKKANMLTANCQFSACEFNNEIYIFGGSEGGRRTCEKYNPFTDTWEKRTDMPHSRQAPMTATINGKIYVFGNMHTKTPTEIYDPIKDNWETKSDMPNCRSLAGTIVLGDKVYIMGGYFGIGDIIYSDIDVYDTKTDTWEKKKPMPWARLSFGACMVNGKIYVIGGQANWRVNNEVWEYDPNEETWIQKTSMPTIRDAFTANVINNKIYCIGGFNWTISTTALSTFDVYDPINDKWEITKDMPYPTGYQSSAVVNNRIYQIGGEPYFAHSDHHDSVWEYNPFPQPTTSISSKESLIGTWASIKKGE